MKNLWETKRIYSKLLYVCFAAAIPQWYYKDKEHVLLLLWPLLKSSASSVKETPSSQGSPVVMTMHIPACFTTLYYTWYLRYLSISSPIFSYNSSDTKKSWSAYFIGGHLISFGSICYSLPFQCSPNQGQAHTSQQGICLSTALYHSGEKHKETDTHKHRCQTKVFANCQSLGH